jgi:glyoxylase-like metal-dependent hydrolase (beta-lactamase superfamily II)
VPVPIPDNPLRYTLVYVVELADGIALVDAGWAAEQTWQHLVDGLRHTGHEIGEVRTVLVTHAHMDHLGLAARVREQSGAAIGMHPAEVEQLRRGHASDDAGGAMVGWLAARGAPRAASTALSAQLGSWRRAFLALAQPDLLIEDGGYPLGRAAAVRAVWTPGHTPGHLCFVDERLDLLFTGDHVLPRISPNISLPPGQDGDPLGDFLNSLSTMDKYGTAEVLPAHEYRFSGLVERRDALLDHHRARLAEAEELVRHRPGTSTWAVAGRLHWSRPWHELDGIMRQSALGEAHTHLLHLQARKRICNRGSGVDAWHPAVPVDSPVK